MNPIPQGGTADADAFSYGFALASLHHNNVMPWSMGIKSAAVACTGVAALSALE